MPEAEESNTMILVCAPCHLIGLSTLNCIVIGCETARRYTRLYILRNTLVTLVNSTYVLINILVIPSTKSEFIHLMLVQLISLGYFVFNLVICKLTSLFVPLIHEIYKHISCPVVLYTVTQNIMK